MMAMMPFGLLFSMAFAHLLSRIAFSSLHFSSFGPTNNDLQVLRKKHMNSSRARKGERWCFQTSNGTLKRVDFDVEAEGNKAADPIPFVDDDSSSFDFLFWLDISFEKYGDIRVCRREKSFDLT